MANLQLNESYFLPDPKEAILIAREGAEVDKCESLKVILARLDASKNQMLLPQPSPPEELHQSQHGMASTDAWGRKAGTRTLSSTMTVGKRSEIGQLGRVIHPKRFAYGRSHGNFFQSSPGLLPYRDLTIWEQHKAITPERSWSESAMRCLSPVGQCLASGFPQHPLEGGGDSTALDQRNNTRKEVNFENLTPVRNPAGEMAQTLPREESATIRRTMRMSWPRMPGGPFAGRQAVHGRSSAERTYRNKTDAAASSYDVLGPHADGPPLPPVHPLW